VSCAPRLLIAALKFMQKNVQDLLRPIRFERMTAASKILALFQQLAAECQSI